MTIQLQRDGCAANSTEASAIVLACLVAASIHAHSMSPPPHTDDACIAARIERSWPSILALASSAVHPMAATRALRQWLTLAVGRFAIAAPPKV